MPAPLSQTLFHPRSIALIGATPDQAKTNSRAQRILTKAGYAGRIIPINPTRSEIGGLPAYPSVREAPGPVDHALIMVPAAAVPGAIEDCVAAGIGVATIYSAGFAEIGEEGRRLQERIVATAREGGLRLVGPNCLGLLNVTDGIPITLNAAVEAEPLVPGWLSMVSQSGSMMGALLSRCAARGLGFAKLASVGNECDLGVGEIAEILAEDEATRAILLFLETFRDSEALARAAARAHALGKPVIAYKLGRSELGRRIAVSHTGAMVGGDELAAAFFRSHGILRVETLEGLVELPRLVVGHRPGTGGRRRAAALTGTGGGAGMIVDRLGLLGDEVPPPPEALRAALGAQGIPVSDSPLIDLPMGGTKGQYPAVLRALLASEHCDAVLAVLGSTARLKPESHVDEFILGAGQATKPLAVFCAPQADGALAHLDAAGIAGFRTPETCADALHAYLTWQAPRPRPAVPDAALAAAHGLLAARAAGVLDEAESCALFAALGIEVPALQLLQSPGDFRGEGSFAVKILSPDIAHKTDAGLVRLGLQGEAAVRAAAGELLDRARSQFPAARIRGALAAPMQRGLAEVILGFRRDPEVGPVVVLGMGGVLAELRRSFTLRLAPVSAAEAGEMVAELAELKPLAGWRNLPRGDLAALARAVEALSRLAALPAVQEAEINPLIIRAEAEGGAVAVDGLVRLG
ncbi:acetate--CoA ligase family protein [Belnapia rosea]|uniref:Acyl-CoA synthetase (NDP forming) n=1 Tax=Belnapia rosea TaxID=938405 RepID=A0A1G6LK09_9PROT|nr:acetate--CoA ligase [Belnapia rosea]SDC43638.1 Acyl-CoA synthetase (NDP forming) [Belnapia rosea]